MYVTGRLIGIGQFYNFGQSEVVTKHAFKQRIQELIAKHREAGPLFLVFHDHSQDVKSVSFPEPSTTMPPLTRLLLGTSNPTW